MAIQRLTIFLGALALCGFADVEGAYAQNGYGPSVGYGYGGPATIYQTPPNYSQNQPWVGGGRYADPDYDRHADRHSYYDERPRAEDGWARERAYNQQRSVRQQQNNQQLLTQQQQYNQQLGAAQQRYNQQVAGQPQAEPIYRKQLEQQAAGLHQQLTDRSRFLRQQTLGR